MKDAHYRNSMLAVFDGRNVTLSASHTPDASIVIERADLADAALLLFRFCTADEQRQLLADMWRWIE